MQGYTSAEVHIGKSTENQVYTITARSIRKQNRSVKFKYILIVKAFPKIGSIF